MVWLGLFSCASIKEEKRWVFVVQYSIISRLLRYMVDAKFKPGENL